MCAHTEVVSEGEARSYIYDSYAFTRLSMFRDVLESRLGNGYAGKAVWPAWCSTRVCANTSLYIVRLSTSQLTRRYWVTLHNSVYLILATKYYSGVSTTECLVLLLAIIVLVVSLVLGL